MIIKYNLEIANKIDSKSSMVILIPDHECLDTKFFTKQQILFYLTKDKVDINRIESIKYYDPNHKGWIEINENETIDLKHNSYTNDSIILRIKLQNDYSIKCKLQEIISSLEQRVSIIEEKSKKYTGSHHPSFHLEHAVSNLDLQKGNSSVQFNNIEIHKNEENYSKIDICFLFSNPIISDENGHSIPMSDPINFEKELQNLEKIFSESGKKIKARFEVANLYNISSMLAKKPKILHITCHGSYEKENKNNFYLHFEDSLGKLDKFDIEKLQNLLKSNKSNIESQIKVVFVSACYSEAIAEIFKSAGIPAVICVQSQTQVLDEAAEGFGQFFYKSLIEGNTIKNSFDYAKTMMSTKYDNKSKYTPCCCFHKHKDECVWKNKSIDRREGLGHIDHMKSCNCKYSESHIHKKDCFWVDKLEYQPKIIFHKDNLIKVCCCSPEIAHDESKKFLIKIDSNYEGERIFSNLENGSLEIKNKNCFFNLKFSVDIRTSLIGRNKELYNIIDVLCNENSLKNHRLVTIYGCNGIGKQTFVKMVGRYTYERKFFSDGVIYIDNKNDMNERKIISQIAFNLNNFKFDYMSMENFFNSIKNLKILIIFNYSKKFNNFSDLVKKILENTNKPKILISSKEPIFLRQEFNYELTQLSNFDSAKLLIMIANDYLPSNLKNEINKLAKDELIKISQGIPSNIHRIAGFLMENKKNYNIVQKMKEEDLKKKTLSDYLLELFLTNLNVNSQQSIILEILYMLNVLPQGLLQENLLILFKGNKDCLNIIDKLHNSGQIIKKTFMKEFDSVSITLNKDLSEVVTKQIDYKELMNHVESQLIIFYSQLLKSLLKSINNDTNYCASEFSATNDANFWQNLDCILKHDERHYSSNNISRIYQGNPHPEIHNNDGIRTNSTESSQSMSRKLTVDHNESNKIKNLLSIYQETDFHKSLSNIVHEHKLGFKPILTKTLSYHFDHIQNPEQRFFHEEDNIYSLISLDNLKKIYNNSLDGDAKSVIESIMICTLTILKIFYRYDDCLNQINNFIKVSEHFDLFLNKARLFIFAISIFPKLFRLKLPLNLQVDNIPLYNYENAIMIIKDKILNNYKHYPSLIGETLFCWSVTNYEFNNENKNINKIFVELDSAKKHFLSADDSFGAARVSFIMAIYSIDIRRFDQKVLDNFKSSMIVFEKNKKNNLVIECLIGISKWYYGINNLLEAKMFAKQALGLSGNLKNNKFEYEINDHLSKIYDQIRKESKNVFVLMRAFQLIMLPVDHNQSNLIKHDSNELKRLEYIKPIVKYNSDFRFNIIETFKKSKKELHVKFDFLTLLNFEDIIEKGGRFLQIRSDVFNKEGSLFMEGAHGEAVEISKNNLDMILKKSKILFDLVVLTIPQSRSLGQLFIDNGVRHVICFEFDHEFLKISLNTPKINLNECFNSFIKSLVKELFKEMSVREATKIAEREFNYLMSKLREEMHYYKINNDSYSSVGEGVILLESQLNVNNLNMFGRFQDDILLDGSLLDLSKTRSKLINIDKINHPYVAMKREIYLCVGHMASNNDINIFGQPGVGKTTFAKEIAYYLHMRNYFIDGIFYFDLIAHSSVVKLNQLFNDFNLFSYIEKNKKSSDKEGKGQDHRLLIIFDNCDKIIKNNESQFYIILKSLIPNQENKTICFLLITNSHEFQNFTPEVLQIPPLTPIESVHFFLAYLERTITRNEIDIDEKEFSEKMTLIDALITSEKIKACNGLPKYLKNLANLCKKRELKKIKLYEFAPDQGLLNKTYSPLKNNFGDGMIKRNIAERSKKDKSKESNDNTVDLHKYPEFHKGNTTEINRRYKRNSKEESFNHRNSVFNIQNKNNIDLRLTLPFEKKKEEDLQNQNDDINNTESKHGTFSIENFDEENLYDIDDRRAFETNKSIKSIANSNTSIKNNNSTIEIENDDHFVVEKYSMKKSERRQTNMKKYKKIKKNKIKKLLKKEDL